MPPSQRVRPRPSASAVAALALVLALSGCDEPGVPLDAWQDLWLETANRVGRTEAEDIPEEECTEVLAYLREQRPMLNPLPADSLEKPVNSWFELAQAAFFECPPDGERVEGWPAAFDQLRVLEAEVATVLERERDIAQGRG